MWSIKKTRTKINIISFFSDYYSLIEIYSFQLIRNKPFTISNGMGVTARLN